MSDRILLVDDDPLLLEAVGISLTRAGYQVDKASTFAEAMKIARLTPPSLAILDIILPDGDGLRLCRSLQASRPVPVIFLTARDKETDIILGLETGADAYFTKPFQMGVLQAQVAALLRRAYGEQIHPPAEYHASDMTLDSLRREVRWPDGQILEMPRKEFEILKLLISRPGEVVSRQEILDTVWGEDYIGDARVLDVHVRWLRNLIEPDPENPRYILTVRGVGYKFNDE